MSCKKLDSNETIFLLDELSICRTGVILLHGMRSCKLQVKVWDYSPAQDLVFHIFSSRMMMAARWERSPVSLNMFMFSERRRK